MKDQKTEVIVVGSGVIGLCSAYYLVNSGYSVKVIEAEDSLKGCSHGNAGHICQSHIIPLANPGVFKKSLAWLLNNKSPFYIRPRLSSKLVGWGKRFIGSAYDSRIDERSKALADIGKLSLMLYEELFKEIGFSSIQRGGIITVCNTIEGLKAEKKDALKAETLGIRHQVIDQRKLETIEPHLKVNAIGGVLYPDDFSIDPSKFVNCLYSYLKEQGVRFKFSNRVNSLLKEGDQVRGVKTENSQFQADQVLLTTGAWADELFNISRSKVRLQPAKGYSFELSNPGIRASSIIFSERKVVLTPMGDRLRVAGTLELSGFDNKIRKSRIDGILEALDEFVPGLVTERPREEDIWFGYRPASPDGLPYMGAHPKFSNLFINAGHAMLGLAFGAASGKTSFELIQKDETSLELSSFDPARFTR